MILEDIIGGGGTPIFSTNGDLGGYGVDISLYDISSIITVQKGKYLTILSGGGGGGSAIGHTSNATGFSGNSGELVVDELSLDGDYTLTIGAGGVMTTSVVYSSTVVGNDGNTSSFAGLVANGGSGGGVGTTGSIGFRISGESYDDFSFIKTALFEQKINGITRLAADQTLHGGGCSLISNGGNPPNAYGVGDYGLNGAGGGVGYGSVAGSEGYGGAGGDGFLILIKVD